ncbi:MAG: Crp/Fnr family transcriptional regulator [Rubrobacteraceae bacterium]|nr:Crp/Fnr family transcriptional regulator [Rubrobacteraceae bacterium]MCL6438176.1 Crp/Fnr family transcriptional regulator [Rubrobacteraceae bacterium]
MFPSEDKLRLLQRAQIFEPLSSEEVERLGWLLPEITLRPGEVLYSPERPPNRSLFLVMSGLLRLSRMFRGREFILSVVRAGQIIGETSLVQRRYNEAYAQAVESTRIAVISHNDLRSIITEYPEVGLKLLGEISQKLHIQEQRMLDLAFKEVLGRLASLILYLIDQEGVPDSDGNTRIATPYTHEHLAGMIGSQRVAVTKAFRTLRQEGAIQRSGREPIRVADLDALRRIAEV